MCSDKQLYERSPTLEAAERQRLREVTRPFARNLMKWQAELAFHRRSPMSPGGTYEDAVVAGAGLGDLLLEVQHGRTQFEIATAAEARVGPVEDASRAFERLLQHISQELR